MPQTPDLNKYLSAGAEFVALTRAQARARARELVAQGQLAQGQVQGFVDDLVDESRKRTDVMLDVVRHEIQRQVKTLGIATKDDLARLEARLAKRAGSPSAAKSGAKKASAKKASAKKASAKKASAAKKTTTTRAKKSAAAKKSPTARAS